MAMEIVKPKLDVVFKKIFGDSENINILKGFLADILDIPIDEITDVTFDDTEVPPDEIEEKFVRFDMSLTTNKGLINVEIQLSNNGDFPERGLYYWAKRYSGQLKKGDGYDKIQPTISIYIVDFKMFDTEDFYSYFTMADLKHQQILTNKCGMYFFELPKLDKNYDPGNKKKLWMQFINAENKEELEMLNQTAVPEIIDGVRVLYRLSEDDLLRAKALRTEKRIRDERTALDHAIKEGLAEGIEIGEAKGRAEGREEGRAEEKAAIIAKLRKYGADEVMIQMILEGN